MDHVYMQEGENVTLLYIHYSELELQLNFYIVKTNIGIEYFHISSNLSTGDDGSFSSIAFGPVGPIGAGLKLQVSSLHHVFSSAILLLALML